MKYIISILLFASTTLALAQEQKDTTKSSIPAPVQTAPVLQHLRFKSIEINGLEDKFIRSLENNDFEYDGKRYKGSFAGNYVSLELLSTPLSKTIYGVKAYFPTRTSVPAALSDYRLMKENLTCVYGNPTTSIEKYSQPYTDGDGYSMKALHEDKATFYSVWKTEIGTITCIVIAIGDNSAALLIKYYDAVNEDKNTKEKKIVIQRDL